MPKDAVSFPMPPDDLRRLERAQMKAEAKFNGMSPEERRKRARRHLEMAARVLSQGDTRAGGS